MNEHIFEEIVNARRSNRSFDPDVEVPDHVMQKSIELAMLSPNSSNMQLWEFYWIKSKTVLEEFHPYCLNQSAARTAKHLMVFVTRRDHWKKHAQWNYNLFKAAIGDKEPSKRDQRGLEYYGVLMPLVYRRDWFGFSTLIRRIICFIKGFSNPFMRVNGNRDHRVLVHKSCALAAQTFMLSISAHGFDSCPMEGFDPKLVRNALKLPKAAEINMIVAVGKGTPKGIHGERKRIPLTETLFKI